MIKITAKQKALDFIKQEDWWMVKVKKTGEEVSLHTFPVIEQAIDIAIKEANREYLVKYDKFIVSGREYKNYLNYKNKVHKIKKNDR